jgi:1-acyl-sn-glycerol-3-phosphate acyltransferase
LTYLKLFLLLIHTTISSALALLCGLIDRSHKAYFILTKIFSAPVLVISGIKVKITGKENVIPKTPYVFVSNHRSLFDIPVLQRYVPNDFSFVFKKEIARVPLFGWQMQLGPHIIIDRQNPSKAMKSIEKAKKMLMHKKISVLLFPEGTRSKTGEMLPFKRGAFHLSTQVGFPIIPVSISGTENLFQKKPFKINPGNVKLHFGEPILSNNISTRKEELELMEKVRDIISKNIISPSTEKVLTSVSNS